MLWAIPGFALVCLNLLWITLLLAIVCLRYRDMIQIVNSVLLLGFFFTPVMWNPKLQKVNAWVVNANPFASFLEVVRAPLMGDAVSGPLLAMALVLPLFGGALAAWAFARYRKQIIYWV
jgi:lipopolysaccharide transport system permease protein